jgi:hypothetical protein
MRRDLLPLVTLDGRHAGELLAHPCDCGRPRCTIGDHIWQSTRDMIPGPQAQSYEPRMAAVNAMLHEIIDQDQDPPPDPTLTEHLDLINDLQLYWDSARALIRRIDRLRPDRWMPLPDPASDDQWCRNHLEQGICEPRDRGDLCRWCYDICRAHGTTPDPILIRARHQGARITDTLIGDFLARAKIARRTKRQKAS